ncbi:MAG: DUF2807 domain-containing protein [Bacteroidales bacterium]|nr:DUF2807 domain-containing protein [Candidatus Cacconaster caballi]
MKKYLLSLFLICATVLSSMAQKQTKTFEYEGFTGLSVSHSFQITVNKSNVFSVKVSVDPDYIPYLDVQKKDDVLHIGFTKDLPRKLRTKSSKIANATISMPVLSAVSLSGSADVFCNGQFEAGMKEITIYMSGASSLKGYAASGVKASVELSGSSLVNCELKAGEVEAQVSGASKFVVGGSAGSLSAEVSGASGLLAYDLQLKDASIKASGASKVQIAPQNTLKVSLSGASSCTYKDNDALYVNARSITGASTLKPAKD